MSVSTRKLIKCKQEKCKIPPVASKTWENVRYNGKSGIPYSLFLPIDSAGSYLVSAVINNGWCKSQADGIWIRDGDLYNDRIHDFELTSPPQPIGKNIQTAIYTTTGENQQQVVLPSLPGTTLAPQQTLHPLETTTPVFTAAIVTPNISGVKAVPPQTVPPQTVPIQTVLPQTIPLQTVPLHSQTYVATTGKQTAATTTQPLLTTTQTTSQSRGKLSRVKDKHNLS